MGVKRTKQRPSPGLIILLKMLIALPLRLNSAAEIHWQLLERARLATRNVYHLRILGTFFHLIGQRKCHDLCPLAQLCSFAKRATVAGYHSKSHCCVWEPRNMTLGLYTEYCLLRLNEDVTVVKVLLTLMIYLQYYCLNTTKIGLIVETLQCCAKAADIFSDLLY